MVSAPERDGELPGPDGRETPTGKPSRRFGRVVAVLVLLAAGGIGVAVTWPEAEPSIASDKVDPPAPVDPNSAAASCAPEDLDVGLAANRLSFTPGVPVRFTMSLKNEGTVQCLVEVPRRSLAVTVYRGEVGEPTAERVWSSADCADPDQERLLLLGPGDVDITDASWPDTGAEPGCEPARSELSAGEYTAQVTLAEVDGVSSDVVHLTYTVPEPSPSPSPSPSSSPSSSGDGSADPSEKAAADPSGSASAEPEVSGGPADDESKKP